MQLASMKATAVPVDPDDRRYGGYYIKFTYRKVRTNRLSRIRRGRQLTA